MAKVRLATAEDVGEVLALWAAAGGPTRTVPTASAVNQLLETDPHALVLAEDDGRVIGTMIAGWDGWRCHLYRLAVDPGYRRKGVATLLVEAAVAHARELGASRVDAMVDGTNSLGQAFWNASAFALDEVEQRWSLLVGT